jgi:nucleotide-binding universal stress UspA family protein
VALHAWKFPGYYDDIIEARTHADDHARETEAAIDPLLESYRSRYPDVEVELSVVHAQPARALLRAAEGADLLVLGRRDHDLPLGSHLGGTARTLLHEAGCPVEVVPPEDLPDRLEDLVLEEAGAVRKQIS